MFSIRRTGVTLVELLITVILIGILSTLALNYYTSYRERTLDREAQANLRLIVAAEKIYKIEVGYYYASPSGQPLAITNINENLRLLLSSLDNRKWNYVTTADGATSSCGQASRTGGVKTWRMKNTEDNPIEGTCPP